MIKNENNFRQVQGYSHGSVIKYELYLESTLHLKFFYEYFVRTIDNIIMS